MTIGYAQALDSAIAAARSAGDLLRAEFHRPGGSRGEAGHATSDEQAERQIRQRLLSAFPSWSFRGEETGYEARVSGQRPLHTWLVDPNDGTAAFLAGHRGSTVSIALLRDGVPVLGVVHAFVAPDSSGDLIAWAEGCGPLHRNGKPVHRAHWPQAIGEHDIVMVSHHADAYPVPNAECIRPGRYLPIPGIACRLALAAAGEGCAGVSLNYPVGWDYAAGHALLRSTGGELVNELGRAVHYTPEGQSSAQCCFGGGPSIVSELWHRPWRKVLQLGLQGAATGAPDSFPARLQRGSAIADSGLLSRAQGCLLGQFSGSSLGSRLDGRTAEELSIRCPAGCRELQDGGAWGALAGQPVGGSELALLLARHLAYRDDYPAETMVEEYRKWQGFGLSGQAVDPLLRVSALGIWLSGQTSDAVAEAARVDCSLTHVGSVERESCAALAVAIALAIESGDAQVTGNEVLAWAERGCRDESVRRSLRSALHGRLSDLKAERDSSLTNLHFAVHQLRHVSNVEEGTVKAAMMGGRAGDRAAAVGALMGAVYGREAVPGQWRRMVLTCRPILGAPGVLRPRPQAFWPVDVMELAELLLWRSQAIGRRA